jgi:hypothetical protein
MQQSSYYSSNWKKSDSVLLYHDRRFSHSPTIIILQLDDCLITSRPITYYNRKIIHGDELINQVPDIYEPELWNEVKQAAKKGASVVIMANCHGQQKQLLDNIKYKTEYVAQLLDIPIIAIYSLLPNRYMKPHTGMFKFLQMLYKRADHDIRHVTVVSQDGGLISKDRLISSDTDRAFAHNINELLCKTNGTSIAALIEEQIAAKQRCVFMTVDEYIGGEKNKFAWDNTIIRPELRGSVITELEKFSHGSRCILDYVRQSMAGNNPMIADANQCTAAAKKLAGIESRADCWVIAIYGAPRSGKTDTAIQLMKQWEASDIGKHHALEYFEASTGAAFWNRIYELLKRGISVIIDGIQPTNIARRPIISYITAADAGQAVHKKDIRDRSVTQRQRFKQDYGQHYMEHKKKASIIRPRDDVAAIFVDVNCSLHMAQLFNHVAVECATNESVRLVRRDEYAYYRAAYEPMTVMHPRIMYVQHVPRIRQTPELMNYRY